MTTSVDTTDTPTNYKMNPEVKAEWVKRLLSGKYKQARSYLRKPFGRKTKDGATEGYCCLGVLCDMYAEATGNGRWVRVSESGMADDKGSKWRFILTNSEEGVTKHDSLPPKDVLRWAGFDPWSITPYIQVNIDKKDAKRFNMGNQASLTNLNDSGRTFKTIANVIEKYL